MFKKKIVTLIQFEGVPNKVSQSWVLLIQVYFRLPAGSTLN